MTDRSFERANDESRERLARLAATLTPAQLAADLGEGWTVASALAHMAFWDRWQSARWRQTLAGEGIPDTLYTHPLENLANVALDPLLAVVAPAGLAAAAIESAQEVDSLIASASDAAVAEIEGGVTAYLLHRHRHRDEHLDQIERGLAAPARAASPTDRSFVERNAASRQRLAAALERLSRTDLQMPTEEGGWTIRQVLGHLSFWDRFLAARWRAALASGPGAQPTYLPDELAGLLNEALAPAWEALGADAEGAAVQEALAAARAVDGIIAGLPAETPVEAILAERPALLDRSVHRLEHLDAIDLALAGKRDR